LKPTSDLLNKTDKVRAMTDCDKYSYFVTEDKTSLPLNKGPESLSGSCWI